MELDAELNVLSSSRHELDGYAYVHDFAFTENHYIVYNNPVDLDLLPLATGHKAPGQVSCVHGSLTRVVYFLSCLVRTEEAVAKLIGLIHL
jgi:all-trans-8'-apo-beta-carotenal 15,15'-oxygenase